METDVEQTYFMKALSRWRESCLFYFKFDLLLVAAVVTVLSFFKIEGEAALEAAFEYKTTLHCLIALLIYAFLFEATITNTSNSPSLAELLANERSKFWMYFFFKWAYMLQVLAHVSLLIFALGFASGYVESYVECEAGIAKCGT